MSLMEKGERNVTSSITNHIILGVINKHAAILLRKVFCVICVIYYCFGVTTPTLSLF